MNNNLGRFRSISKKDHKLQQILCDTVNPLIKGQGYEVENYFINPHYGNIEMIIDNIKGNKRVVIAFNDKWDGYIIYVYLQDCKNQPIADYDFTCKVKNLKTSLRFKKAIEDLRSV